LLDVLRASGGRVTSPRREVLHALIEHQGHPTAEELTAAVQARQPDVHGSTIYRFLETLEQLGIVDHVHLGHGPAVYHFVDDAHFHLVCRRCRRVVEVPDDSLDSLRRRFVRDFDFDIEARHFAMSGSCKGCAASA
jgi:Fe2+ or Zn2+ uptake regulation protein